MLEEVHRVAQTLKAEKSLLTTKQYRRLKRFDIISLGGVERLFCARSRSTDEIKYYVSEGECFRCLKTHCRKTDSGKLVAAKTGSGEN